MHKSKLLAAVLTAWLSTTIAACNIPPPAQDGAATSLVTLTPAGTPDAVDVELGTSDPVMPTAQASTVSSTLAQPTLDDSAVYIAMSDPTSESTPDDSTPGEVTPDYVHSPEKRWLEVEMQGVELGLWLPDGWVADFTDGLILAEHVATIRSSGSPLPGMLVYIFVPRLDDFALPDEIGDDHNLALLVLEQVITMPHMIGKAAASIPVSFMWSDHDAAYYLLTSDQGTKTLVIAVALPNGRQLVVCNVSLPAHTDAEHQIRDALPALLDGLTINGQLLYGSAFDSLPDAFIFPQPPPSQRGESTPEATEQP